MKKLLLTLFAIIAITTISLAQKGTTLIGVAAEVGIPTGDFGTAAKTGFGGSVHGLFGIGTSGDISFTTGYTSYGWKNLPSGYSGHSSIIPLLAGYRHNFSGFFIEPQAGYGIYGGKVSGGGTSSSSSDGAFTWAIGAGYGMNGWEGGVRYQSASKNGSSVGIVGIHVGYNFGLGAEKK